MTRDPFEQLRDRNPVPTSDLPSAPMATAERIMERARFRNPRRQPGWVIAAAAAVIVLVGGGAWMLWLGEGGGTPPAAAPASTAVSQPPTSSVSAVASEQTVVAYFLLEGEPRASLVPVERVVTADSDASAVVAAVLSGVIREEGEAEPGLFTSLPAAAEVEVVSVSDGEVTLDLSADFIGYDSPDALAQIVFSLTRIDGIDGVRFTVDGTPHAVVVGDGYLLPEHNRSGYVVDDPATRLTFEGWMSLAMIEDPPYGAVLTIPGTVSGVSSSIGDRIGFSVTDEGGNVLWATDQATECGTPWSDCRGLGDWSTWQIEVPAVVDTARSGYLVATSYGSGVEVIGERRQPVVLQPLAGPIPEVSTEVAVYHFIADDGSQTLPGPYLIPTMRTTAVLSAPVTDIERIALEFLLAGPTPGEVEAVPSLSSEIPPGTRLLDYAAADRVATVDLSSEFVSGGGSSSMRGRLAQVIFTLTQFDDVDGVRFLIDGAPTTIFGGEGVIVGEPGTRADFEDLLPAIFIEFPTHWATVSNPAVVRGTADVFEATVSLSLADGDGRILWEGFATAECGTGCRGGFEVLIPYEIDEYQLGSIMAWEESAEDGRPTNVREHAVWLTPSGESPTVTTTIPGTDQLAGLLRGRTSLEESLVELITQIDTVELAMISETDVARLADLESQLNGLRSDQASLREELSDILEAIEALGHETLATCSGANVGAALPDLPDLPGAVAATRAAVFEAAVQCDWGSLEALTGPDFTFSFGAPPGSPAQSWRREEGLLYEPMRNLAETLRMPPARLDSGVWVWPAAFAYDRWDQVAEADLAALESLYDATDIAGFDSFGGFFGYRIGISESGEWLYFVAGD